MSGLKAWQVQLAVQPKSDHIWVALRVAWPEGSSPSPLASKFLSIPSWNIFRPPPSPWILCHKIPKNSLGGPYSSLAACGRGSLEHMYSHLCPITRWITFRTGEASTFDHLGVKIGTRPRVFKWSEPGSARKNFTKQRLSLNFWQMAWRP